MDQSSMDFDSLMKIIQLKGQTPSDSSNDRTIFWLIERKDLDGLRKFCGTLKEQKQDVGMYFGGMKMWTEIFTTEEARNIKVYLCGIMDFCPIQHAADIDWKEGMACLFEYDVGCKHQGCGLPSINKAKFLEFMKTQVFK